MKYKIISALTLLFLLLSCSQESDDAEQTVTEQPVLEQAALEPPVQVTSISTQLPRQLPPQGQPVTNNVDHTRLVNADSESDNWLLHGRTYDEQRYSPLTQINNDNVNELKLAWHFDFETKRGLEASPVIVDGVMYASGSWSRVYTFIAITGELLWEYDPEVPGEWAVNACCDVVNRGVAVSGERVFVGTIDGRLIALNKNNGAVLWDVQTTDPAKPYSITGAPRVVRDKVFIGNGGAEFGVRGYISAYNIENGEMAWRFYTVPGNPEYGFENETMEMAAKTWNGEWWRIGGGGTAWDSMAYDAELDLLYFGVGNGSPWNQKLRSPGGGDNLFLASIVAVKPDTGEYVWHYQTTPGESWDFTATQHIMLADLVIAGEERKVLMQAPKNGFFYVIDRQTGELISAEAFVPVNWATHVDLETGKPVENPQARYYNEIAPQFITPMWLGGHNWHPMAYSPKTGLVYIPAQEMGFPYAPAATLDIKTMAANIGLDMSVAAMPDDPQAQAAILAEIKGHLSAWDPVAQKERWRVQHPGPWNGGILATAGNLLFQGNAAGFFVAYRADNGEELWSYPSQTGVIAPPVSFAVDGEQYVSVLAGWGGTYPLIMGRASFKSGPQTNRSRLLTFKLGGTDELPDVTPEIRIPVDVSGITVSDEQAFEGLVNYGTYCTPCHGGDAIGGGVIPDLRYSAMLSSLDAWNSVVIDGALEANGMASFDAVLSNEQSAAIYNYVIRQTQKIAR